MAVTSPLPTATAPSTFFAWRRRQRRALDAEVPLMADLRLGGKKGKKGDATNRVPFLFKAKPARNVVKALPLKALKEMVK
jgi:hypothetical protein